MCEMWEIVLALVLVRKTWEIVLVVKLVRNM